MYLQALMDSNLPRLQLELYKEIKKVRNDICTHTFAHSHSPCCVEGKMHIYVYPGRSHLKKKSSILTVVIKLICWFEERCLSESEGSLMEVCWAGPPDQATEMQVNMISVGCANMTFFFKCPFLICSVCVPNTPADTSPDPTWSTCYHASPE